MTNFHIMRKVDLVKYLKENGLKSSFPKKADIISYLRDIKWSLGFPWRDEQSEIITTFIDGSFDIIALQGLFGCGKTTMLLGMLNLGFWKNKFRLDEICFCAFNVCIKNEIRKKISAWGVKQRPMVRTFDSIIYELCEFYKYPHLKKPNYEGKRKYVIHLCRKKNREPFEKYDHIRFLFIDEAQDLEKNCFIVFQTFFKNARMVLVGDIFQSIQKEPRESLLWWITHQNTFPISYFYMKETPRVPKKIFTDIKTALTKFYPEYQEQIVEWKSLNTTSDHAIQWVAYETYTELYKNMFEFIDTHDHTKSMILTFSSCITVRGSLGDLARIRQLIEKKKGIPVNSNYKNMDKNSLFLSTANSSKGLERDFVFIVSTFPLEKAFINFSKDLTMNLITVAISRAKVKAIVCVPKMTERFSTAFYSYPSSPKPDHTFFPSTDIVTISQFLNLEHSVTDILRQNVIKYDTRMYFQSFVKKSMKRNCFPVPLYHATTLPKSILRSEEERAFVGVCIEVLMTSTWTRNMPRTPGIAEIEFNPMYAHCISHIKQMRVHYHKLKMRFKGSFDTGIFPCVFAYTELFMAIQHKIFFHFGNEKKQSLERYWSAVRSHIPSIAPSTVSAFQTQKNIKMMNITGIMDGYMVTNDKKHIFEIKASVKSDWKEDAFIQAFIYGIQLGQTWFHIHLMNLFKNEYIEYVVFIDPGVVRTRNRLLHDVGIWNMNSFLAKCPKHSRNLEECVFIHSSESGYIVMLSMNSPTRIVIDYQSDDLEETRQFFADHDFDLSKKYILCNDDGFTPTITFPFPVHDIKTFFSTSAILGNIDSVITPPEKEEECVNRMPLDNPVIRTVLKMVALITVDD